MIMMNGEIPQIPITTLAGIASLTDLLPELPLPTPMPQTVHNKSLLYHPRIAEEARRLLASRDENLVPQLIHALSHTNVEHIELKDNSVGDAIEGEIPELLKAVLAQNPAVFKSGRPQESVYPRQPMAPTQLPQQMQGSPYQPGNNMSPYHPGSPARFTPYAPQQQAQGNLFAGSPYGQQGSNKFQSQFAAFAAGQPQMGQGPGSGAVNGGDMMNSMSPGFHQQQQPYMSPAHNRIQAGNSAAGSPGHAISHPVDRDKGQPTSSLSTMDKQKESTPANSKSKQRRRSSASKSSEPVVVLEPLSSEDVNQFQSPPRKAGVSKKSTSSKKTSKLPSGDMAQAIKSMTPTLKLTRIDADGKKEKGKSGTTYVNPSGELQMKFSKDSMSKGTKRRRSIEVIDADEPEENFGGFSMTLSERIKRRRRTGSHAGSTSPVAAAAAAPPKYTEEDSSEESRPPTPVELPKSSKKKKDKKQRRLQEQSDLMSPEELMETGTFKRFNNAVDGALEAAEDADMSSLSRVDFDDESVEIPPEILLSKSALNELCSESAKLKAMGVMNQVPYEKLVKLLTVLAWNIRDGAKILPNMAQDNEGDDEEQLWRELTMERVMRSVDASLTSLYVMTSPDMPKQVYLEDVIDRILILTKFQLLNTIYPEYDPVYRVDPKNKEGFQQHVKMKRARSHGAKHKTTIALYNKITEIVGALAELINIQELTDTLILQVSSLGCGPFFVENVSELQLNSMKVVTTVYSGYEKHRALIIEDIFASIARLPSSKKNLRSYRLNADQSIQMLTALVLQLIQSVIALPKPKEDESRAPTPSDDKNQKTKLKKLTDDEVIIITNYENAMRSAHNFLAVFLRKCSTKGEEDYRPLFENFVQDLLATVNKPEWGAAELLLSLLGTLLVKQFSNKSVEMSIRVASLDYLGIVASTLRRDAINSQMNQETIDEIIDRINNISDDDSSNGRKSPLVEAGDQIQTLQKALLDYLAANRHSDPAVLFSRNFLIAQWIRDATTEAEKIVQAGHQKKTNEDDTDDSDDEPETSLADEVQKTSEALQMAERRKQFLFSQITPDSSSFSRSVSSKLDYDSACLVARYLASTRPFSQSFDVYLTQILKVLCETAVAVRTKAMKCLTAVVEADPGILARPDMQRGVHGRFLDQSTSVREAAVELVGKFILIRPELTTQYYEMLSDRILDTGISVRKRVIKIFRDICTEQPDFSKIPEMCVKMIRRINDEEGIKKLVNEVFQNMWFTVVRDRDTHKLLTKVLNITDVVAACKDSGYEWFETLLGNLLKKEADHAFGPVEKSCRQIIDCLVENVLKLEAKAVELTEGKVTSSQRLVACLSTLYLFCKIKPDMVVQHAETLQPYLDIKCSTQGDYMVLHYIARVLELVVPLMEHPSEGFLAQLEEDMMKLVLKHGMMVVQSCVSCLGSVINLVSHNYKLVRDCFQKFFGVLCKIMTEHKNNPKNPALDNSKPTLLRALFTVGLLCRHFDFDAKEMGETKACVKDRVFDVLMYFISHEDEDVKHKALTGVGYMCIRYYDFMLGTTLKQVYHGLLTYRDAPVKLKNQVLRNLQHYLTEEEDKMQKADAEWRKVAKKEDLKEMGLAESGMASTIMQLYLKQCLESFFHPQFQVRITALTVISLILKQGLVHPVQCMPYLISMSTDCEANIRLKADQQMQEIDKKYPGFVHMKALAGIKMSYRLQQLLQADLYEPIRGIRDEDNPTALCAFLYTLIRGNRSHRRALLTNLLNMFDDSARNLTDPSERDTSFEKTSLNEMVYIADNLAFLPYQYQDEPLFIMHQTDIIVSVSGSNLVQAFMEGLTQKKEGESEALSRYEEDDEEEDEFERLLGRFPEDTSALQDIRLQWQGCILLMQLKQHLKEHFGFKEQKISQYSPSDPAKMNERPLNRKGQNRFNPKLALDLLKRDQLSPQDLNDEAKRQLLSDFLEFKQLMLSVDPAEDDSDQSTGHVTPQPKSPAVSRPPAAGGDGQPGEDGAENGGGDAGSSGAVDEDDDVAAENGDKALRPEMLVKPLKITLTPLGFTTSLSKHQKSSEKKHKSHKSKFEKKKKHKKKKRKRRISTTDEEDESDFEEEEEEDEEDESEDPDFNI
ncbi:nipped-B-like protein B isoform X1 [Lingula anatina]|uniref:Nipped-B protein n=1 Tax=Lingula anatina TaxID=7574 RepID=A0A1S3JAN9_LINAN|nr:nipped-B-like protein B isoform X1 [Lingula anatina]XP_013407388.1 nipped-B-like protein B isoform X1 [Lingula anatina]|eukprot:XP_013407379.1 nipped-B-like protein B isoform X1 [Lingula anatina]